MRWALGTWVPHNARHGSRSDALCCPPAAPLLLPTLLSLVDSSTNALALHLLVLPQQRNKSKEERIKLGRQASAGKGAPPLASALACTPVRQGQPACVTSLVEVA